MESFSTGRLLKLFVYSRLNDANKEMVRRVWERERWKYLWAPRKRAQKRATVEIAKAKSGYRSTVRFAVKHYPFHEGKNKDGVAFARFPLFVDEDLEPVRRLDPIAFRESEPGHDGPWGVHEGAWTTDYVRFYAGNIGRRMADELTRSLDTNDFRALRLANKHDQSIADACPFYVLRAQDAMFRAIRSYHFPFDPTNKRHQSLWNDALDVARLHLTARESQTRKPRHMVYSRLNERNRRCIDEALRQSASEGDAEPLLDMGAKHVYVKLRFRREYLDVGQKEFYVGLRDFAYAPEDLAMTIPIAMDRPAE